MTMNKLMTSMLLPLLMAATGSAHAELEQLSEEGLSQTTGEGIAYLPENIKIVFDDTAYIRTLPSTTTPAFPTSGRKPELVWYGLALTAADGNVSGRVGNAITSWGTANNPWILKVETLSKVQYNGVTAGVPILSYYAPTYTLNEGGLKYAFWSDLVVRDSSNNILTGGRMQTQSVWNDVTLNGSRYSIFQNTYDQSFGVAWLNRINSKTTGQFRFSAAESNQPAGAASTTNTVSTAAPTFQSAEGMYVTDFDINMIVGNLHYQPMIMGASDTTTQNFQIELVRIPNNPAVYNEFYRDYSDPSQDYKACDGTKVDCSLATHGQLSIGKLEFKNALGTSVDLGSAKYDGLMVQHLKIRTLGL